MYALQIGSKLDTLNVCTPNWLQIGYSKRMHSKLAPNFDTRNVCTPSWHQIGCCSKLDTRRSERQGPSGFSGQRPKSQKATLRRRGKGLSQMATNPLCLGLYALCLTLDWHRSGLPTVHLSRQRPETKKGTSRCPILISIRSVEDNYTLSFFTSFFMRRRAKPAAPTPTSPTNAIEDGSGTAERVSVLPPVTDQKN